MDEAVEFPQDPEVLARDRSHVLALSGGGYRGLFTACILAALEEQHGVACAQAFDVLAGTSIGGIIAGALAVGVPARKIRDTFIERGEHIFPSRLIPAGLQSAIFSAPYATEPLRATIVDILGDLSETTLGDLREVKLLLPAVSVSAGAPRVLRSRALVPSHLDHGILLVDAMLASAAAPTYFSSKSVGNEVLVDGGLIANAPDVLALSESFRYYPNLDRTYLLSIGTCGESLARPTDKNIRSGGAWWVARRKLVHLVMAAQERLAIDTARQLLGSRYGRLDGQPTAEESAAIGLDKAGAAASEMLTELSRRVVSGLGVDQKRFLATVFSAN